MDNDDLDPYDGGASSIERWGSEPVCSFDPETGFSINPTTIDELRWYTYLSLDDDGDGSLLESRNDE